MNEDGLEQQPAGTALPECVEQPEDVTDQPRVATGDAGGSASLAEILTGEPGCDHVHASHRLQFAPVACQRHAGEARLTHTTAAESISHRSADACPARCSPNSMPPLPANTPA